METVKSVCNCVSKVSLENAEYGFVREGDTLHTANACFHASLFVEMWNWWLERDNTLQMISELERSASQELDSHLETAEIMRRLRDHRDRLKKDFIAAEERASYWMSKYENLLDRVDTLKDEIKKPGAF